MDEAADATRCGVLVGAMPLCGRRHLLAIVQTSGRQEVLINALNDNTFDLCPLPLDTHTPLSKWIRALASCTGMAWAAFFETICYP